MKSIKNLLIPITILCLLFQIQCGTATKKTALKEASKGEEWIVDVPGLKEGEKPLVLIRIPAGTFQMGSPDSEEGRDENEAPVHSVTIGQDFYLGKYEVTQAQWEAVMGYNPSTEIDPNYPVNKVSWQDCQAFFKKLGKLVNETGFRLPTEAEREYACRAGTTTAAYYGDAADEEIIEKHAWSRINSDGELHEVGQLKSNPWGLHDMYGNVWEWCSDWFGPYSAEAQTDPQGPETGEEKVFRGGSWMARPEWLRSADRGKFTPDNQRNTGGFRVAFSE